jgi:predicted nucleic acid-binding Zn ribbon protein
MPKDGCIVMVKKTISKECNVASEKCLELRQKERFRHGGFSAEL